MTDIETISICDVDYTDRPSEREDVEVEARISGVIQRLGLLPANKIFAGFCQYLAAFWRGICHWRHIDTYIVLSQKKRLESFAV